MAQYVSHARTISELKDEFLSDIQRRLDHLDQSLKQIRPNASEAARIARVRQELLVILDYWKNVELKGLGQDTIPGA
jgi:hypothetical protein